MKTVIFVCVTIVMALCFAMRTDIQERNGLTQESTPSRTLLLLRHAKSDKSDLTIPDITRPLENSGRKEAAKIGKFLAKQKIKIDVIISSPSIRTKQSLEIICRKIDYPYENVKWDSSLYACTGTYLVDKIRATNDKYKTVMYVGHNPSITYATNELQIGEQYDEIRTCGLVAIDFTHVNSWLDVTKEKGALRFYRKP